MPTTVPFGFMNRLLELGPPKTKGGDPTAFLATAAKDRDAVEAVRQFKPGDVVLDVGCGYGRLGTAFADTGVKYHGVDVNAKRLAYARQLLHGTDCEFHAVDARNDRYNPGGLETVVLPLPAASVDAVYAISVFTHMARPDQVAAYLAEIARVAKPDAVFLSTWLTAWPAGEPSTDYRAYHAVDTVHALLDRAGWAVASEAGAGTVAEHRTVVARRRP